ncbi:MAG: acetyl-CoA carboxylase biotin carboxyl carrier protein [Phycisphaerae bacterium]|jgi:acetyl-CoA carboxylase biotin carboxyl carrier protein
MAQKDSDLQKIEELIEIMKANDLVEVEIKHGDDRIFVKRSGPQSALGRAVTVVPMVDGGGSVRSNEIHTSASEVSSSGSKPQEGLVEIKSPLIGTFYATPSPDSDPYVEVGSHVDEQTVVCIIEAMKVMNEIKAEISGTITEIVVTSGQAVEYGQVLFRVKPD